MKPPPLGYARATGVGHALALLAEHGDEAKPIAGGQSLMPLLNLRLARPAMVVDINHIEADDLAVVDGVLVTGALVRHRQLCGPEVAAAQPLVAYAARFIGHPAIRNRGTVGGSLAHGDPAAELVLAAVASGARIVLASVDAVRDVPAEDFFLGPFMTGAAPYELVLTVQWPAVGHRDRWGFAEVAERTGDFAMAAAAIQITVDGTGDRRPVVAVTGLAGTPQRLPAAEELLRAGDWAESQLRDAVVDTLAELSSGEERVSERTRHLATETVVRAAAGTRQEGGPG